MATAYRPPEEIKFPSFNEFFDEDGKFDNEKYRQAENNYIETLAAEARQNGDSDLLGEVVKWQRADGYAMYMVWNTEPLELVHLEGIADGYTVEEALIRGLRLTDVNEMVENDRKIAEIFAKRKGA